MPTGRVAVSRHITTGITAPQTATSTSAPPSITPRRLPPARTPPAVKTALTNLPVPPVAATYSLQETLSISPHPRRSLKPGSPPPAALIRSRPPRQPNRPAFAGCAPQRPSLAAHPTRLPRSVLPSRPAKNPLRRMEWVD
ncbi:hypothetical protein B0H16DRAFT_1733474 [Mycena metata]|uniref:Uncharacterized protein n=1 Tax=Mycena metata TaxID=1033252 RepID=A0AAD7HYM4_9AGAR|nr:hypothetical protein B0H16DRAFT_1733474 [Mycena metata]